MPCVRRTWRNTARGPALSWPARRSLLAASAASASYPHRSSHSWHSSQRSQRAPLSRPAAQLIAHPLAQLVAHALAQSVAHSLHRHTLAQSRPIDLFSLFLTASLFHPAPPSPSPSPLPPTYFHLLPLAPSPSLLSYSHLLLLAELFFSPIQAEAGEQGDREEEDLAEAEHFIEPVPGGWRGRGGVVRVVSGERCAVRVVKSCER